MDKYSIQKKKFEWEKGLIVIEQGNIQYQQIMIKLPTLNNQNCANILHSYQKVHFIKCKLNIFDL